MPQIKNARKTELCGMAFKSRLEAQAYIFMKPIFDHVGYEETTFVLQEGYYPESDIYAPDKATKRLKLHKEKIRDIKYTVDFTVVHNGMTYYVETKGMVQELYAMKKKMLFKDRNIVFFEVHNKRQLMEAIEMIKNNKKTDKDEKTKRHNP